jgi:hypothetical protein
MKISRLSVVVTTLALASTFAVVGMAPASAKGGERRVEARGKCSSATIWKMKAKPDNGRLQVELEIDSSRNGQTWTVAVRDNGVAVFSGRRVTKAPSGSFSVEFRTPNRAGADKFVGTARNTRTGEVCTARVTY